MNNRNKIKAVLQVIALMAGCICLEVWLCACTGKEPVAILSGGEEITVKGAEDKAEAEQEAAESQERAEKDSAQNRNVILVHICGAVRNPGVYEIPEGGRICHAVESAGGFTLQADENYLNQAQLLQDGMRIYIPTKEETKGVEQIQQSDGEGCSCRQGAARAICS